jgi:hypothetical protein
MMPVNEKRPELESHRFAFFGLEVVAGFSVACLLTLTLMPPPLNVREKIATCSFAIALPLLVSARALLDDETDPSVWEQTASLRIGAHVLAIFGFGVFLSAIYWPASIFYGVFAVVSPVLWIHQQRRTETPKSSIPVQQDAKDVQPPTKVPPEHET